MVSTAATRTRTQGHLDPHPYLPVRCAALVIVFLLPLLAPAATTREEIDRISRQLTSLGQRVLDLESRQQSILKSLQEISIRLEALERASRTADIRADLDILKRQVEALATRVPPAGAESQPAHRLQDGPSQAPSPEGIPLPPGPPDGEEDLYARAQRDFAQGRYDLAATQFRQFAESRPSDGKAGSAQYWVGECLYTQKRFGEARDAFQAVPDRFPQSPKVRAARLKIGLCWISLGDEKKGLKLLEALVQEAPDSPEAQIARDRLARVAGSE